uniref:Uncharacterized protein n=1 Tax=Globisporangium ultimum (strain ATCC 200006 / CBS 805.95 / DAOM BR144) TaxID=431595 RepID=K3WCD9_GLOUD
MAEENAKLSSLFNKKKKKGGKSTTVNANVIAKEQSKAESAAAAAARPVSPAKSAIKTKAKPVAAASPSGGPSGAPVKTLADLSLNDKNAPQEKMSFQWAKQPKKYKDTSDKDGVARTWEEQEERNRLNKRLNLNSERAFPTLGVDAEKAQLSTMKAPKAKAVEVKNVWASLHHADDEDSD